MTKDARHGRREFKDKVPAGKVYIELSSKKPDISDFWQDLRETRARQQQPADKL